MILTDAAEVLGGPKNWSSGFLPASYQGTLFRREGAPILDLAPPSDHRRRTAARPAGSAALAQSPFRRRAAGGHRTRSAPQLLRARVPDAVGGAGSGGPHARRSEATRKLYGMDNEVTAKFGTNCLLARRLVERGVRFIELYSGSGSGWDAHNDLDKNHSRRCQETDVPIAGLLTDLKARGLLDSTLVVWGGEFGRTPFNEKGNGRDHNPWGFTMWMAGGGIKGGTVIGRTDEIGLRAVERPVHVHDLHATILWAWGWITSR